MTAMTPTTAVAIAALVYFAVLIACIFAFVWDAMRERRQIREMERRLEDLLRAMRGER